MAHRLRMAVEVRTWLEGVLVDDPPAARLFGEAVTALLEQGAGLGPPLVVTVESRLRAADPLRALDHAYQRQIEALQTIRRATADVATARKRSELQVARAKSMAQKLGDQIRQYAEAGRDDLAAEARARRSATEDHLVELYRRHAELRRDEEELTTVSQRLQMKVDTFRSRKDSAQIAFTVARAWRMLDEALGDIGEEIGDGVSSTRPDDAAAAARSAAEELLGTTDLLEHAAREVLSDAALSLDLSPPDLSEVRLAALAGRDLRILFAIEPPGTVVLLPIGDDRSQQASWYDAPFTRAQIGLRRLQHEQPDARFTSYDKRSFLHAFFAGEHSALEAGAARLVARNRVCRLGEVRRQVGLTREQVAERMGVPPKRVSAIERAKSVDTDVRTLAAYVEALGGRLEIIADLGAERMVIG